MNKLIIIKKTTRRIFVVRNRAFKRRSFNMNTFYRSFTVAIVCKYRGRNAFTPFFSLYSTFLSFLLLLSKTSLACNSYVVHVMSVRSVLINLGRKEGAKERERKRVKRIARRASRE